MFIKDVKTVGELEEAIKLLNRHPDTPIVVKMPYWRSMRIDTVELMDDGKAFVLTVIEVSKEADNE